MLQWTKIWGMKFNTVKCVQMTVTNKRKILNTQYYLGDVKLIQNDSVKYLGVTIDKKLTFGLHVKQKIKSATTILNMLRRNLYFAPKSVKMKAYQSCVLPILEYASSSWQPTSDNSNNALEMVQHNAARWIANAFSKKGSFKLFSISKILSDLQMATLEERRNETRLTMAYKILNEQVILEPNLLPKLVNTRKQRNCNIYNVGIENQLLEPKARLKTTGKTFFFSIPKIWNEKVTPAQASAPSTDAFKKHFKRNVY